MPCEEPLVGEIWLSDMTVEGMRLGERLDVFVAGRREPCCRELLDVAGMDEEMLSTPSGSGLADALWGVLAR